MFKEMVFGTPEYFAHQQAERQRMKEAKALKMIERQEQAARISAAEAALQKKQAECPHASKRTRYYPAFVDDNGHEVDESTEDRCTNCGALLNI